MEDANQETTSILPPASTAAGEELEDYLDISEQKNRPDDLPINNQRINAWHPILDPNWVIFTYLILAAIMIPFGTCSWQL